MEKSMKSNDLENKYGLNKLAKAIDCLNSAAEIFENSNMTKEADQIIEFINVVAQAIMPEYTTIPKTNVSDVRETWRNHEVKVDNNGKKYIINGNLMQVYLPDNMQINNSVSRNRFGLSPSDVERTQLALNKVINDFQGSKPEKLIPDQKWGPSTEAAFSWYDKNTHKAPLQSLKALLDGTSATETISGK